VPICGISGRLDEAIAASLQDDDRSVVFDLGGATYLSSAGIRIFLALKRQLKERRSTLALSCVG